MLHKKVSRATTNKTVRETEADAVASDKERRCPTHAVIGFNNSGVVRASSAEIKHPVLPTPSSHTQPCCLALTNLLR